MVSCDTFVPISPNLKISIIGGPSKQEPAKSIELLETQLVSKLPLIEPERTGTAGRKVI